LAAAVPFIFLNLLLLPDGHPLRVISYFFYILNLNQMNLFMIFFHVLHSMTEACWRVPGFLPPRDQLRWRVPWGRKRFWSWKVPQLGKSNPRLLGRDDKEHQPLSLQFTNMLISAARLSCNLAFFRFAGYGIKLELGQDF
jgi:hypothetical protein